MIATSPEIATDTMRDFAESLYKLVQPKLEDYSDIKWQFHQEVAINLSDDDARYASDFLDRTSLRMVEGPYDAMLIITNVPILSSQRKAEPGLSAEVSRVMIISSAALTHSQRDKAMRSLTDQNVLYNGATLLLHLVGHLLHLNHTNSSEVMKPYSFKENRNRLPEFTEKERIKIKKEAQRFPDQVLFTGGIFQEIGFYIKSVIAHPREVFMPLLRNRAPLIPLSLSRLSTAAVTPSLVLVFSAEIWDVAFHLSDARMYISSIIAIILSGAYLMVSLKLQFPRTSSSGLTEHGAIVNISIFLTLVCAMIGLYVLLFLGTLGIEYFIFPEDLMREWPSLDSPSVSRADKFRLAGFISILGVITGALAGGLESRSVVRELALFRDSV